jgi:urease accessory protein
VKADVGRMVREGTQVRGGKPILLTNCHTGEGVDAVVERIAADVLFER